MRGDTDGRRSDLAGSFYCTSADPLLGFAHGKKRVVIGPEPTTDYALAGCSHFGVVCRVPDVRSVHNRHIAGTTAAARGVEPPASALSTMATIRDLRDRNIVLRSLREGIDTANATGRMVAGVLASLAELELELGRERRAAAREARRTRGQSIGRPRALDKSKSALAQRMHASGESASTIAATLDVSRATVYRVLAEQTTEGD